MLNSSTLDTHLHCKYKVTGRNHGYVDNSHFDVIKPLPAAMLVHLALPFYINIVVFVYGLFVVCFFN